MLAYVTGRLDIASALVDRASSVDSDSLLTRELAAYLRHLAEAPGARETAVYQREPEAFQRFIRGGGNIELYRAVGDALRDVYDARRPETVLDIGSGDGRAVSESWSPAAGVVELVEPAEPLLAAAVETLTRAGVPHHARPSSIEDFLSQTSHSWPLVQATFSLQSLPPSSRAAVLQALLPRCDRLVIVEFDVPKRSHIFDPWWFVRCLERMERGVAEYGADCGMVAQGFLLPMMLGFFTDTERTNHEQPVEVWADEVRMAGFNVRPPRVLNDYWWAPAFMLEAVASR